LFHKLLAATVHEQPVKDLKRVNATSSMAHYIPVTHI